MTVCSGIVPVFTDALGWPASSTHFEFRCSKVCKNRPWSPLLTPLLTKIYQWLEDILLFVVE